MKWLIIQSAGVHNGSDGWTANDYLRECVALQYGIQQYGHSCDVWGKRHDNFNIFPDIDAYDFVVLLENYEFDWVPDLSQYSNPTKLHWIVDLHCHNPYERWSRQCDIVLHSTKSLMDGYKKMCPKQKHIWFPNAVDERYFYNRSIEKTIECCFVGSPNNRASFINSVGIPMLFKTGVDMIDTISKTKIHFNKSISCDVNYRCFETIGLGTCLLSNTLPELLELGFTDGQNCILYDSLEDCISKLTQHLKNDEYLRIGTSGYTLSKQHTYCKRITNLLEIL